jgi:hypothetical protein
VSSELERSELQAQLVYVAFPGIESGLELALAL